MSPESIADATTPNSPYVWAVVQHKILKLPDRRNKMDKTKHILLNSLQKFVDFLE